MKLWRCKWCGKIFDDAEKGNKHGITCGMTFHIVKKGESMTPNDDGKEGEL